MQLGPISLSLTASNRYESGTDGPNSEVLDFHFGNVPKLGIRASCEKRLSS